MSINTDMTVRVAAITQVAEKVKRFRLERVDGEAMPIFSGGSHVVVAMRDGDILRRNTYSLMSSPADTTAYELSILRVENSRGGSAFLHEKLKVGDTLVISQPLNLFPFDVRGKKHLFMAGGIGITPFMAMMDQMTREDRAFELHYAVRNRKHGAYWKELSERYGAHRVKIYCDEEKLFIPVDSVLQAQSLGTHLYVCGPEGMINGVLTKARRIGLARTEPPFRAFPGAAARQAFPRRAEKIEKNHRGAFSTKAYSKPWKRRALTRHSSAVAALAANAKPLSSPAMARWSITTTSSSPTTRPRAARS